MHTVVTGLRQIARSLWRRPAFTLATVASLSLGLAGVIGVMAIADMVVLRPLPYPRPERLVSLSASVPGPDGRPTRFVLSAIEFLRVRERAASFEQVEAMTPVEMAAGFSTGPVTTRVGTASAGYLRLFGLDPVIGRAFDESEDRQRALVVVLDGGYWQRQFGGDAGILGRTLTLDGKPHQIIGVTAPGVQPQLQQIDAWVPLAATVDPQRAGARFLLTAARLRPGVSEAQARDELDALHAAVGAEFPETHASASFVLTDMHEQLYGSYRPILALLFAGVCVLLLIACTNVANLTLARVADQQGEIALRLSLGASRRRIIGNQLAETAILASLGAAGGGLLGWWTIRALVAVDPSLLPADVDLRIRPAVAAAVIVVLAAATLIAGLVPAMRAASTSVRTSLAEAAAGQLGRARDRRAREWLLGAQVAFAVVLLGAATLVGTAFQRLTRTNPGFDYDRVLTMQLAPPTRYPDVQGRAQFLARTLDRIAQIPGVVAVGSTQTTWRLNSTMTSRIQIDGYTPPPGETPMPNFRHITPGYFAALGPAIVEGRAIDARDTLGMPMVAMVSRAFADRFFPGESALGRRVRRGTPNAPWLTIVGVVANVMDSGLGADLGPTLYVPYFQQNTPTARITLVVRTTVAPEALGQAVQQAIWAVDPQQPVDAVQPLAAAIEVSTAQPRLRAMLLALFGTIGALMACMGVYGVAAYAGARRRREVGLRIALGAEAAMVRRLLVRQSMMPVLIGGAAGVALASTLGARFTALGPDAGRLAWWTLLTAALLAACGLVATWVPAYRATRVSPVVALRLD